MQFLLFCYKTLNNFFCNQKTLKKCFDKKDFFFFGLCDLGNHSPISVLPGSEPNFPRRKNTCWKGVAPSCWASEEQNSTTAVWQDSPRPTPPLGGLGSFFPNRGVYFMDLKPDFLTSALLTPRVRLLLAEADLYVVGCSTEDDSGVHTPFSQL